MERISPLVALPCGHCVCVDDFKRLGHDYPAQAPNLPRAAPLPQPRAAPSPTPFDTELSPTLGPSAGMVPPPMQATGRWRSGVLWSLNRLWAGRWSYGSSPPHSPTRRGGSPTHGGSMLHSSRDPAAIPERRLPLPSGSATMSPGEALAAWTQERQQNDMVVRLIRTHGRSYQEGEVLITFGELREFEELRAIDLPTVLLRARAAKLVSFSKDGDAEEANSASATAAFRAADAEAPLEPEEDDEVVITTLQLQAARADSQYRAWRKGSSYVPHRAAAPLVDLDEGQLNYVLIKAVSPPLLPPSPSAAEEAGGAAVPTEVVTLVRGFTKREYPHHADVLEAAGEALAQAGYTSITCAGGGVLWHTPHLKTLFISGGPCQFGTADHLVTRALLRQHFPADYHVVVIDEDDAIHGMIEAAGGSPNGGRGSGRSSPALGAGAALQETLDAEEELAGMPSPREGVYV